MDNQKSTVAVNVIHYYIPVSLMRWGVFVYSEYMYFIFNASVCVCVTFTMCSFPWKQLEKKRINMKQCHTSYYSWRCPAQCPGLRESHQNLPPGHHLYPTRSWCVVLDEKFLCAFQLHPQFLQTMNS